MAFFRKQKFFGSVFYDSGVPMKKMRAFGEIASTNANKIYPMFDDGLNAIAANVIFVNIFVHLKIAK